MTRSGEGEVAAQQFFTRWLEVRESQTPEITA